MAIADHLTSAINISFKWQSKSQLITKEQSKKSRKPNAADKNYNNADVRVTPYR
jgi:hypothetical protein